MTKTGITHFDKDLSGFHYTVLMNPTHEPIKIKSGHKVSEFHRLDSSHYDILNIEQEIQNTQEKDATGPIDIDAIMAEWAL